MFFFLVKSGGVFVNTSVIIVVYLFIPLHYANINDGVFVDIDVIVWCIC